MHSYLTYPLDSALILQKKRALRRELLQKENLIDKKVAIVSGSTVGEIKPILELFLLNSGIRPSFFEGEYGLFYEDIVFGNAELSAFAPDILYIHTSSHNLRYFPSPADTAEQAAQNLQDEYAYFEAVWQAAKSLGCPIIQNNFEPPSVRNFGNLDAADPRGRVRYVNRLNELLANYADTTQNFYIHDLSWLASVHGLDAFCDAAAWYAYQYACAPAYIPQLCHSLASLMCSLFGITKKGVVCDLANTLWGGIVGEVGPEGIELGSETPTGRAYSDFQAYLSRLSARGVLLSVASKNEEAAAEAGLSRTDGALSRKDFLSFHANWGPKSQSIAAIAKQLNIGADSLVFVDDNPAERAEVQGVLPQVAAPPITQPEDSAKLLDRSGYFEVSSLSADDLARGEMYRQNAQRESGRQTFASYSQYLQSLDMHAEIIPFTQGQLERITQLINKTNQFNLTTRRYTLAEVERCAQEGHICLSGRLQDRFGDNGLTSVIIGQISGTTLDISLWVMSCRVFKRNFEYAMFDALVAQAQAAGIKTITGSFLPTAKNLLVRDFYATIGFSLTDDTDECRRFSYTVPQTYQNLNTVIKV